MYNLILTFTLIISLLSGVSYFLIKHLKFKKMEKELNLDYRCCRYCKYCNTDYRYCSYGSSFDISNTQNYLCNYFKLNRKSYRSEIVIRYKEGLEEKKAQLAKASLYQVSGFNDEEKKEDENSTPKTPGFYYYDGSKYRDVYGPI